MRIANYLLVNFLLSLQDIHGYEEINKFVQDVIEGWSLHSPIIVGLNEAMREDICLKYQWRYLCLSNDLVALSIEVSKYLAQLHNENRLCGTLW